VTLRYKIITFFSHWYVDPVNTNPISETVFSYTLN
jgi:hypothetical protein